MTQDHRNGDDKIEIHYRLQLSALMDGALPPDEARFLLRRMQHDTELGGCWERWQLAGETLRGRAVAPLPADFSQRVAARVAAEPAPPLKPAAQSQRWTRWGGGALAASVALLAFFMTRQQPPAEALPDGAQPAQIVAASSEPSPASVPATPAAPPAADPNAADPNAAGALAATAVAVAEVPRRAANRRVSSSRSQAQRAALRASARENLPVAVAASNTAADAASQPSITFHPAAASAIASSDPFASQPIAPSRPWPSATLPQFSSGALSVDYGTTNAYYPFQPRLPASSPPADSGSDASLQETPQR
ncbi:sigma-E factor negative regulatory protein [Luteimonas sp. SX5]|uniref:Sigma-E factor negative regulatory protein n=1 Tax=Luteimonas galliterrae TaxID=2940486 RepID=A0ABT0MIC8_9GAMM|nr:sigma-E factor negative regulatory protein [Luteimonas galliterrae]MCL1634009.1 sigma-E factor negative regulatory protein [Luteimonas galliterrae]